MRSFKKIEKEEKVNEPNSNNNNKNKNAEGERKDGFKGKKREETIYQP